MYILLPSNVTYDDNIQNCQLVQFETSKQKSQAQFSNIKSYMTGSILWQSIGFLRAKSIWQAQVLICEYIQDPEDFAALMLVSQTRCQSQNITPTSMTSFWDRHCCEWKGMKQGLLSLRQDDMTVARIRVLQSVLVAWMSIGQQSIGIINRSCI